MGLAIKELLSSYKYCRDMGGAASEQEHNNYVHVVICYR